MRVRGKRPEIHLVVTVGISISSTFYLQKGYAAGNGDLLSAAIEDVKAGFYQKAISLLSPTAAYGRKVNQRDKTFGLILLTLGEAYIRVNNYADAMLVLRDSVPILEQSNASPTLICNALENLALAYIRNKRIDHNADLAAPLLEQSLKIKLATLGKDDSKVTAVIDQLVQVYQIQGKQEPKSAVEELLKSLLDAGGSGVNLVYTSGGRTVSKKYHEGLLASEKAEGFINSGEYQKAEELLSQSIKVAPDSSVVCSNYAYVLRKIGRVEESIPVYKKAISLDKNNEKSLLGLAIAYNETGDYNNALSTFRHLLRKFPDSSVYPKNEIKKAIGWLETKAWTEPVNHSSQITNSSAVAEKVQVIDDLLDTDAVLSKAVDAYYRRDIPTAETLFKRVLKERPDNVDANYSLGLIAEENSDFEGAINYYQRALKFKTEDQEIVTALKKVTQLQNSREHNFEACLETARNKYQSGNYLAAKELLDRLSIADPSNAKVHFALGQCLRKLGDSKQGFEQINIASNIEPENKVFDAELAESSSLSDVPAKKARNIGEIVPFDFDERKMDTSQLKIAMDSQAYGESSKELDSYLDQIAAKLRVAWLRYSSTYPQKITVKCKLESSGALSGFESLGDGNSELGASLQEVLSHFSFHEPSNTVRNTLKKRFLNFPLPVTIMLYGDRVSITESEYSARDLMKKL